MSSSPRGPAGRCWGSGRRPRCRRRSSRSRPSRRRPRGHEEVGAPAPRPVSRERAASASATASGWTNWARDCPRWPTSGSRSGRRPLGGSSVRWPRHPRPAGTRSSPRAGGAPGPTNRRPVDQLADEVGVAVVARVLLDHVRVDPPKRMAPAGDPVSSRTSPPRSRGTACTSPRNVGEVVLKTASSSGSIAVLDAGAKQRSPADRCRRAARAETSSARPLPCGGGSRAARGPRSRRAAPCAGRRSAPRT